MTDSRAYAGRELEAMALAQNYHRWILMLFQPFLGKRIVEVGAGAGSFSELLLHKDIESLTAIEPSQAMYQLLNTRLGKHEKAARITTYNAVFGEVADEIKARQPDSIIYVNVLEHIEDDEAELETIYHSLETGGRIFVLVPAWQRLFGEFDRQLGHHRRYGREELVDKCMGAGFKVLRSGYLDIIGVMPWWIKYRLLKSVKMEPAAVSFYDRFVIPVSRTLESIVAPPIGKNLVLIGEKT